MQKLLIIALALAACQTPAIPTETIPVLVPLSGPDAARGAAVLDAVDLLQAELDEIEQPSPQIKLRVSDSSASDERIVEAVRGARVVVVGGCREARALAAAETTVELVLVLFCESLVDRGEIERTDNGRFYWFGPSQANLLRGVDGFLRDDLRDAQGSRRYYSFFNYVNTVNDETSEVSAIIDSMEASLLTLNRIEVNASDSSQIVDYTAALQALEAVADKAAAESPPIYGMTYLRMPWLTTLEFVRQASSYFGDRFAGIRSDWVMQMDYQAADAPGDISPFSIDQVNFLITRGNVDFEGVQAIDTVATSSRGRRLSSTLSRLSLDALAAATLTAARMLGAGDTGSAAFLAIQRGNLASPATTVSFHNLSAGVAAARAGDRVQFDGIFSNIDQFDAYGQLTGDLRISIARNSEAGAGGLAQSRVAFFNEPMTGRPYDLRQALNAGQVRIERPVNTQEWGPFGPLAMVDRSITSGLGYILAQPRPLGMILHFEEPQTLTGFFLLHYFNVQAQANVRADTRIRWWTDPLPDGIDPVMPVVAPSGEKFFPRAPLGPWVSVDWSFMPQRVSAISVYVTYESGDTRHELFNDLAVFVADEGAP